MLFKKLEDKNMTTNKLKPINKRLQRGYFFADAFGDMMMLAVGVLILVIALQIFTPFANILANTVAGSDIPGAIMVIIWAIPLLLVAILIMPVVHKIRGGGQQM
jgi:hypothetical protein